MRYFFALLLLLASATSRRWRTLRLRLRLLRCRRLLLVFVLVLVARGSIRHSLLRWHVGQRSHAAAELTHGGAHQPRHLGGLGRAVLERHAADGVKGLEHEYGSGRLLWGGGGVSSGGLAALDGLYRVSRCDFGLRLRLLACGEG